MKTVRKILVAFLMFVYFISTSSGAIAEWELISVESVEVQYETQVKVSLNNEIDVNALSDDDITILHDINVSSSDIDPADARKVLISLDEALEENSIYNIITIKWIDGSMDFQTENNLEWEEIFNESAEGIESVFIIDPKSIEVTYYDPIVEAETDLKLFRDLPIISVNSLSNTQIEIGTVESLNVSNNYIFMLIGAKNIDNSDAEIESGIYNFETPSYLDEVPVQEEEVNLNAAEEEEEVETPVQEVVIEEAQAEEIVVVEEEVAEVSVQETVTTTETEEVSEATEEAPQESNIEAVAAEATAVPETGTASSIMILITMLLAFGVHMKKRK